MPVGSPPGAAEPWNADRMGSALAALLSGAVLYVACVAALSLHVGGASSLWWCAVAAVALCHAGSGFLTMGRGVASSVASVAASATGGAISLGITGIVSVVALLLVFRFPIHLSPGTAMLTLGACVGVGAIILAIAFSRRNFGTNARRQSGRH